MASPASEKDRSSVVLTARKACVGLEPKAHSRGKGRQSQAKDMLADVSDGPDNDSTGKADTGAHSEKDEDEEGEQRYSGEVTKESEKEESQEENTAEMPQHQLQHESSPQPLEQLVCGVARGRARGRPRGRPRGRARGSSSTLSRANYGRENGSKQVTAKFPARRVRPVSPESAVSRKRLASPTPTGTEPTARRRRVVPSNTIFQDPFSAPAITTHSQLKESISIRLERFDQFLQTEASLETQIANRERELTSLREQHRQLVAQHEGDRRFVERAKELFAEETCDA